jgi:hypothetical protein
MSIIEHGDWTSYSPDPHPEDAPLNAMFARRDGDAQDWYSYVNLPAANFQPNSVKMTIYRQGKHGPTVGAAVFDATMLYPGSALVVEDTGYSGTDPQADYDRKIYDPETQTFSDPPPEDPGAGMRALIERVAALEAKLAGSA